MKYKITFLLGVLSFTAYSFQSETLFTIDGDPVTMQEFTYFYKKNKQMNNEDNSTSVTEYLDLFIDFKLKVADAKRRGYDTTTAFVEEFNNYSDQLLESFLHSKDLEEELVLETYERLIFDLDASHILIRVPENSSPGDTIVAYNKAMEIYEKALNGENFETLAANFSEEPGAKISKGRLGFFTVFQMVYPFESAAYALEVGEISKPVRTNFGFHIIKLNNKRRAVGTVEVAHIMTRLSRESNSKDTLYARSKIFAAFEKLESGVPWDSVCSEFTEDLTSKPYNGKLKPFGVRGLNVQDFEQAAFNTPVGRYSKPFQTPFGWHIVKVINKAPVKEFEHERENLERRLRNSPRSKLYGDKWIKNLKTKHKFNEFSEIRNKLLSLIDSSQSKDTSLELFSLNEVNFTIGDLLDYIGNQVIRSRSDAIDAYNKYVESMLRQEEETFLTEENLDYKMLKQEYYEGILLFSIMEDMVWKKAELDSIQLHRFYEDNKSQFTVNGFEAILLQVSPDSITHMVYEVLLGNFEELGPELTLEGVKMWAEITLSSQSGLNLQFSEEWIDNSSSSFEKLAPGLNLINETDLLGILILNQQPATRVGNLDEVRGKVVSALQEKLEKDWLNNLHSRYKIKVHKKVLNKVINEFEGG